MRLFMGLTFPDAADGDTLNLKRIMSPSVTRIVAEAPEDEPNSPPCSI
jgi:hypothetical protein